MTTRKTVGLLRAMAPITEVLATTFRYNYKQMKYDPSGSLEQFVCRNIGTSLKIARGKSSVSRP